MSEHQISSQDRSRAGSNVFGRDEDQVVSTCQDPQTIVLAPLIKIFVDFAGRKIIVTQNGEPMASAQAPLASNELTVELRPACSIPIPGRHPEGEG